MPFRKENGQTHLLHTKNWESLHIMERLWTIWFSLVDKTVKNLPAMHKTWVQSLGQEDPLKKGMATHSSVLAWRIPWQRSLTGYLLPTGLQRVGHNWATFTFTWAIYLLTKNSPVFPNQGPRNVTPGLLQSFVPWPPLIGISPFNPLAVPLSRSSLLTQFWPEI